MSVVGAPYELNDPQSLDDAIRTIRESGYRYVSLAPGVGTFSVVAQRAHDLGLRGEDYVFFVSEGTIEVVSTNFALNATTEYGAASILNGTGIVLIHAPGKEEYQSSMIQDFLENPSTMEYYTRKHPAKDLFLADDFRFDPVADAQQSTFAAALQHSNYDAIMALGLAACNSEKDFFTGPELYENIKSLDFSGASQIPVYFRDTCSRDMEPFQYTALNLVAKEPERGMIKFDTRLVSMFSFRESLQNLNETVIPIQPHIFRDGTSIPKPSIPGLEVGTNLIPQPLQILGWILAGIVMTLSLALGVWTVWKQRLTALLL